MRAVSWTLLSSLLVLLAAVPFIVAQSSSTVGISQCIGTLLNNTEPALDTVTSLFVSYSEASVELNIPPRYMWGWGGTAHGYCGSFSFQSAALYFGSYISAQFLRYAANNNDTQLLIGDDSAPDSFDYVASTFQFNINHFNTALLPNPQADQFLNWTQAHLAMGHPVITGLFEWTTAATADSSYDHIVPIVGLTQNDTEHSLSGAGTTNVTAVLYNDLYLPYPRVLNNPLAATRTQWLAPSISDVTLPLAFTLPMYADYGVAVLGVKDTNAETFRTKLTSWSWTEPDWGDEDGCNEAPQPLNLSIAVYGLTPGQMYSILRFDGNTSIPSSGFINGPYAMRWNFTATASVYVQSPFDTVSSKSMVSYRTVLNTNGGAAAPATPNPTPNPTPSPSAAVKLSGVILGLLLGPLTTLGLLL